MSNCVWKIEIKLQQSTNYGIFELSYDGTDLIHYIPYARTSAESPNQGIIVVDKGPVPFDSLNTSAEHVWFAFASSCYFEKNGTNRMWPLWWAPKEARSQVPCEITLHHQGPPFLPEAAIFYDDGYTWDQAPGGIERRRRAPPFDSGYIRLHYSASGFTNLAGFVIPSAFSIALYQQRLDEKSAKPVALLGAKVEDG